MTQLFWPVVDAEQQEKAVEAASKRLVKLDRFAFNAFLGMVSGFRDLPPRQRFATYVAMEDAYGSIVGWLAQLEMIDATEAIWLASDYASLLTEYRKRGAA